MMKTEYKGFTFYCHNLGGLDATFIIKNILLFNNTENGKANPYLLDENNN